MEVINTSLLLQLTKCLHLFCPKSYDQMIMDEEWWHIPEIPATQEIEINRIAVGGQPRQKA
jgi:hypothetical protein